MEERQSYRGEGAEEEARRRRGGRRRGAEKEGIDSKSANYTNTLIINADR